MQLILTILQVIVSFALIITILLQQRGTGGSSIFGAGASTNYYTKRGIEKLLFVSSIVLAALFITSAFLNLLI